MEPKSSDTIAESAECKKIDSTNGDEDTTSGMCSHGAFVWSCLPELCPRNYIFKLNLKIKIITYGM